MSKKVDIANAILERLHGKKCLIIGNHDHFISKPGFDASHFEWITHYRELNDNNRKIILCHYPVMCYNGQYRRNAKGAPKTYMLYGHVHNTYDEYLLNEFQNQTRACIRPVLGKAGAEETVSIPCQMINCFCMFSDYVPLTLDEWIEVDRKRRAVIKREDYI